MSAIGATNVSKRVSGMEISPEFDGYSRVVIQVTDELSYEAGVATGRTLELKCPWGTQQMADDILGRIWGYQYQPFTADGALVDPAAELGDGVTVSGVYSGIYKREIQFDALCASSIEAPQDEELDHEFPFQEVTDRTVIRQFASTKAQFAIQADQIAARVTREGGDNKSFGWSLTEDGFILSSGSKTVFKANEDGIEVTGKITATSGYIGNGSSGFTITSNAIYNGVQSLDDTSHYGVHIATNGITLGKGAFKVDSAGNLTASNGTFGGTVRANQIQYGDSYNGTFNGAGLTSGSVSGGYGGAIGSGTVTTANTSGGINTSLGYADFSNGVFNGWNMASAVWASSLRVGWNGTQYWPGTISFIDGLGQTRTFYTLVTG